MIIFEGVTKTYDGNVVGLDDVSFHIPKGEFVFLVGPSGSGKSTLIRLVLRELRPDKGRVIVSGRNIGTLKRRKIPHLRRNIGCVFQDFKLLPNKTVYENVAYALQVVGEPRKNIRRKVPEILKLVGLFEKMNNLPSEISGGEEQRVSIARAFVNKPPLLLADEPTGNLDPETSIGIMQLLERINRTGTTVVIATHDRDMVNRMRKRVFALDRGRLIRDERQGSYERPLGAADTTGELRVPPVPVAAPAGAAPPQGAPQPAGQTGTIPVPAPPTAVPPTGPGQTAPIPASASAPGQTGAQMPAGPGQTGAQPAMRSAQTQAPAAAPPGQAAAPPGAQNRPPQAVPQTAPQAAPGVPSGQMGAGAPAPGVTAPQPQAPAGQPVPRPQQAPQAAQTGQLPRQTPPTAPAAPQGQATPQPGATSAGQNGSGAESEDEATRRSSGAGSQPEEARR